MSNVNPNHYKVAGRERQGDGLLQERHRQAFAGNRARDRFEARQVPSGPSAPAPEDAGATAAATAEEPVRPTTSEVSQRSAPGRRTATAVKKTVKTPAAKNAKKAAPAAAKRATSKTKKAAKPAKRAGKSAKTAATSAARKRTSAAASPKKTSRTKARATRGGRKTRAS